MTRLRYFIQGKKGFTIVELLVVIIVIAILAGIVIVGYGSWRKSTAIDAVRSDLKAARASMDTARNFGTTGYPATIPPTFQASQSAQVTGGGRPGGASFCVAATSTVDATIKYYVSNQQTDPVPGDCTIKVATIIPGSTMPNMWGTPLSSGMGWGIPIFAPNGTLYLAANNGPNAILATSLPGSSVAAFSGSGVSGGTNGPASSARFSGPSSIAVDKDGVMYVGDTNNNSIRRVAPDGTVSTIASVSQPNGVTLAPDGATLYVSASASSTCDAVHLLGHKIYKVASGTVTLLSGTGVCGSIDGDAATAQFNSPNTLAVNQQGDLFLNDRCRIRKISSTTGYVSNFVGTGTCGTPVDGPAASAIFKGLQAYPIVDSKGTIYIIDSGGSLRVITTDGIVATLVTSSIIGQAYGLTFDTQGNVWGTDLSGQVFKITLP